MTDETIDPQTAQAAGTDETEDARLQVLQGVVDRITSWHEGSDEATIRAELDNAIAASDVDIDEETRQRIVEHVQKEGPHVDVRTFLA